MRRVWPVLALVIAAAAMLSCGGAADLPSSSAVSVSISPASATIGVGQTVELQGTAVGFTRPTLNWWQQDQHDAAVNGNGEEDCDYITAANSGLIPSCKFGYLTGNGFVDGATSRVTYHAPATPGVYHVTLRCYQMSMESYGAAVEKRAKATITVTQ